MKERKKDYRLTRRIKNTETKIFAKLKNICLLQLLDPIKNLNEQEIIILEDTNGLKQSKRIENCSEKLDSNLTSTIEARILPPNVDVNKQIKFVGINAEGWKVMSEKEILPVELRQTADTIAELEEKVSENVGDMLPA